MPLKGQPSKMNRHRSKDFERVAISLPLTPDLFSISGNCDIIYTPFMICPLPCPCMYQLEGKHSSSEALATDW